MKILLVILLIILFGGPVVFYNLEKKEYNNGKCKCGGDWEYFATDSQGGAGYKCSNCGKVVWHSWYK